MNFETVALKSLISTQFLVEEMSTYHHHHHSSLL